MHAAVVHKLGNPPRFGQFAEPVAGANEVVVQVLAASLKPVDRQMVAGSHYASPRSLPFICGMDGVGRLESGERVFFGGCRAPYGAMAQRTVVPKEFVFRIPAALSDEAAAALPNPGVSAWLTLSYRAKLRPGEHVLVLGATGVTGQLAVKIAKLLGAGRVVAAGRNQQILQSLLQAGADAIIRLDVPIAEIKESFAKEAGESSYQVVIDYLWGQPTEAFLSAITSAGFAAIGAETRLIQVGESAGPNISLSAAVLRSTALTIQGTAGIPPGDVLFDALQKVMSHGANGDFHLASQRVPLSEVEMAWERSEPGTRIVFIP
jgi:NADPH:quinone reductase-like Zn-dependent oxidoreductase